MASSPTFSVKQIQTYKCCPHQYFLRYVRKRRGAIVVNSAMARGSTAHAVLGQTFNAFRQQGAFPTNLRDRVSRHLPRRDYDDDAHWQADIDMVTGWIDIAVSTHDPTSQIVAVERVYTYPFPGRWGEPAFALTTRIDLITRHEDETIEHIDWKTGGTPIVDRIQTVGSRIALGRTLQEGRIRSTTRFLALDTCRSATLTRDEVRDTWEEIKDLAQRIIADDDWEPVENALCPYCPYRNQGCPLRSCG